MRLEDFMHKKPAETAAEPAEAAAPAVLDFSTTTCGCACACACVR